MATRKTMSYCITALITLSAVSGCLKRKETLVVSSDGTVKMKLKYKGSAEDLKTADAMPSREGGWEIERSVEKDGDEEKHVLRAKQVFAPGEALPGSYAAEGSPEARLVLAFPTTLRIEQREDGVYYHFRRVYLPRRWGYVRYWHDRFINDEIEKLGQKQREDLSLEERVKILKAFADIAAREQIEFARLALARCSPDLPQDRWLLARQALLRVYQEIDYEAFVKTFESLTEEERDARFDAESERIIEQARSAMAASLQAEAGYDPAQVARFNEAYDAAEREYDITDETGGHQFVIRIRMPGRIVAHNADTIGDEDDADVAVWDFNGEAFRDRGHEIMITSRLQPSPN